MSSKKLVILCLLVVAGQLWAAPFPQEAGELWKCFVFALKKYTRIEYFNLKSVFDKHRTSGGFFLWQVVLRNETYTTKSKKLNKLTGFNAIYQSIWNIGHLESFAKFELISEPFFEVIEIVANSLETISLARIVLQCLKSVWQVENVLLSVIQNIFIDTLRETATILYEC